MFSLDHQRSKLASVNPRAEIHGTDHVMAADLKFECKLSNDVLNEFDPKLKAALYAKDNTQGELYPDESRLTRILFPLMAPVAWASEFAGYETQIHYGIDDQRDIRLADCEVDKFSFECQEGGTVVVRFRVIAHPTAEEIGRLCEMIQLEIDISLIEPKASEDLLTDKGGDESGQAAE